MKNLKQKSGLLLVCFLLIPLQSFAYSESLGQMARGLTDSTIIFSQFLHTACFVIGGSFLFASFVKYMEYRRSPLMIPISTVIFLFVAGIVLLLLPLLSFLLRNSIS